MKKRIIIALLIAAGITAGSMQQAYALDFMYEDDVYSMCEEICKPYKISPELAQAIIWKESRYATDAVNGPCIGLMQIKEECHKDRMKKLGVTDLYNPYDNILVGVDYLAELYEKYEDTGYVLDVYNGRSDAKSNFEKGKLSSYSKSVTELAAEKEEEHDK